MERKTGYIAWALNGIPFGVYENFYTAQRLSFRGGTGGEPCRIEQVELIRVGAYWFGPVHLISPSASDKEKEQRRQKAEMVLEKAKDLGLTNDEINTLKGELNILKGV